MKSLGLYLFIFGIGSMLLNIMGLDFKILGWIDTWGTGFGYLLRLGLIVLGLVLMFGTRKKPLTEQFPELEEIHRLSKQNTEETAKSDSPSPDAGV